MSSMDSEQDKLQSTKDATERVGITQRIRDIFLERKIKKIVSDSDVDKSIKLIRFLENTCMDGYNGKAGSYTFGKDVIGIQSLAYLVEGIDDPVECYTQMSQFFVKAGEIESQYTIHAVAKYINILKKYSRFGSLTEKLKEFPPFTPIPNIEMVYSESAKEHTRARYLRKVPYEDDVELADPLIQMLEMSEEEYASLFTEKRIVIVRKIIEKLQRDFEEIKSKHDLVTIGQTELLSSDMVIPLLKLLDNPKAVAAYINNFRKFIERSFSNNRILNGIYSRNNNESAKHILFQVDFIQNNYPEIFELGEIGFDVSAYYDFERNKKETFTDRSKYTEILEDKELCKKVKLLSKLGIHPGIFGSLQGSSHEDFWRKLSYVSLEKICVLYELVGVAFGSIQRHEDNSVENNITSLEDFYYSFLGTNQIQMNVEDIKKKFLPLASMDIDSILAEIKKSTVKNEYIFQDKKQLLQFIVNNLDQGLITDISNIASPDFFAIIQDENYAEFLIKAGFTKYQLIVDVLNNLYAHEQLRPNTSPLSEKIHILGRAAVASAYFHIKSVEVLEMLQKLPEEEIRAWVDICFHEIIDIEKKEQFDALHEMYTLGIRTNVAFHEKNKKIGSIFSSIPGLTWWIHEGYDRIKLLCSSNLYGYVEIYRECEKQLYSDFSVVIGSFDMNETFSILEVFRTNPNILATFIDFCVKSQTMQERQKKIEAYLALIIKHGHTPENSRLIDHGAGEEQFIANRKASLVFIRDCFKDRAFHVIPFLLSEEILTQFPSEEQKFWKFLLDHNDLPNDVVRFICLHKKAFESIIGMRGEFTVNALQMMMGEVSINSIRRIVTDYYQNEPSHYDADFLHTAMKMRYTEFLNVKKYLTFFPEIKEVFIKLYRESEDPEYTAILGDRDEFWDRNVMLFCYLTEIGFTIPNFQRFRSFTNNSSMSNMITVSMLPLEEIGKVRERLKLTLDNMYYINSVSVEKIMRELENPDIAKFYRTLLAQQPRSFISVVSTIMADQNTMHLIQSPEIQQRIFRCVQELGNMVPSAMQRYVLEQDSQKRSAYVEEVRQIKSRLLKNEPVKSTNGQPVNLEVVAENICLTFPGTQIDVVRQTLSMIDDRCGDLEGFSIQQNGYVSEMQSKVKAAVLKKGLSFDKENLKFFRALASVAFGKPDSQIVDVNAESGILKFIKDAGSGTLDEWRKQNFDPLIAMTQIAFGQGNLGVTEEYHEVVSPVDKTDQFLGRCGELLGIYYKDNAVSNIEKYLEEHLDILRKIVMLFNEKRLLQMGKNFVSLNEHDKSRLTSVLNRITSTMKESGNPAIKDVSELLAVIIEARFISGPKGMRKLVKKEMEKIEYETPEGTRTDEDIRFTGHVSKNAASFFAKTTAGVCTAQDKGLFDRPEHFHINLVRNEEVVGNIQGYVIEHEGKKSLLFRGFNPSISFVNKQNAEAICEGMMSIVKQFSQENGISDVFIAEQTGWHSLTNRVSEGVIDFFIKNYFKQEREVVFPYEVSSVASISKMYRI